MPPGLNRGEKPDKDDNPNPPDVPENPGTEDSSDKSANKANKGTHIYTYDELNRMATSNIAKTESTYTYDTLGNLVSEKVKNKTTDYQYNELNQLVSRSAQNQQYTYTYDKRGNRVAETGKKESQAYVYDETNRLVEGTNWKGDKSSYTYNGVGVRINHTETSHSGSVYSRDYVIDYTSLERDDLMVYAAGDGQLNYVQREVYAGSERIEQYTDRSNGGYERLLYVHEDLQGNTRYYTKENGQSFAELTYDAWGMPESPNKLLNNDHGNYVYATYTGHIFDTTLDIYFAEFRFYDAATRQWLAMDPIKDGGNWYQYCYSNPLRYWDPTGLAGFSLFGCGGTAIQLGKDVLDVGGYILERFFPDLFNEALRGNPLPSIWEIFQTVNRIEGRTLQILGAVFKGIGDTLQRSGMSLMLSGSFLFGGGLAGALATGLFTGGGGAAVGLAIADVGAIAIGAGAAMDLVGKVLTFMGEGLGSLGDDIARQSKSEGDSDTEVKVNEGQQNKHIPGTNEYENLVANGNKRSTMNGDINDIQKLLDEKAGTGTKIGDNKERVDFGQVIGQYVDPTTGEASDTTIGIIHYGNKGAHIVPARPKL